MDKDKGLIKEKTWSDSQRTTDKAEDVGFVKEKPVAEKTPFYNEKLHDENNERSLPGRVLDRFKDLGNTIYDTILGSTPRDDAHSFSDKVRDKADDIRTKAEDRQMLPVKPREQTNSVSKPDIYNKDPATANELVNSNKDFASPFSDTSDAMSHNNDAMAHNNDAMAHRHREIVERGFDDVPGSLTGSYIDHTFVKETPDDVSMDKGFVKDDVSMDKGFVKEPTEFQEKTMSERARGIVEIGFDDVPGSLTSKDW